jgi:hypothetical protein
MNIYLLTPGKWKGRRPKLDFYDSAVVIASSETDALTIHPGFNNETGLNPSFDDGSWPSAGHVFVKLLGKAESNCLRGVVCASFNAA